MTVREALDAAGRRLGRAGIPAGSWDAELLLRHVLGWDRARIAASADAPLSNGERGRFEALVTERAARRPLQHLVGTQAFWRHEFLVTPDVLIPRPESELLVEAGLELMRSVAQPVVVDVGTGSGCVALSIAAARRDAQVHAVDISEAALDVARQNARRLGLEERVSFHAGAYLAPIAGRGATLDLVVSNPPYVDPRDLKALEPEVRDHEPWQALFAGGGHYGAYERLAPEAAALLRPGGWLLMEMGDGMASRVEALCQAAGLDVQPARHDLRGFARVAVARRRVDP